MDVCLIPCSPPYPIHHCLPASLVVVVVVAAGLELILEVGSGVRGGGRDMSSTSPPHSINAHDNVSVVLERSGGGGGGGLVRGER
ncbi:hypothetical protein E2C01_007277 [Portunus trituberculatus]|uniref:Uncharacterized protein n=1 Tax=Portunus trituberculatus TaxID=210409 RepID=A0A5B7CYS0_PORTR|nr:hypothetical protein [Portunus trituberculatus]